MTIKSLAKLSVFALLINYIGKAEADSFSLAVRGTACADVSAEQTRSEIRYRAYDKAVLLAVKNSPYVRQEAASMDDYGYNVLAYRLADKALNDITVITVRDDNEKICLEVSGELDQEKTNAVLRTKQPEFNPSNVKTGATKINV